MYLDLEWLLPGGRIEYYLTLDKIMNSEYNRLMTVYEHRRKIRYTLEWVRTVTALLVLALQMVILAKLFW